MQIRRRSPLLLLLIPSLVAAIAIDSSKAKPGSVEHLADDASSQQTIDSLIPTRPDKGTKDAPVDGQDGKPHAGPFVDTTRKKLSTTVEDLGSGSSSKFSDEFEKSAKEEGWEIPEQVDSVMTKGRGEFERTGLDGTEGGVSSKDKERKMGKGTKEKRPEGPKEVLKDHEIEKEKVIKGKEKMNIEEKKVSDGKKIEKDAAGLEKPADLPDKPHDIPHPAPNGYSDTKGTEPPHKFASDSTTTSSGDYDAPITPAEGVIQPFHSYILSLTMILVSEVGDKTFLVAALMAMRHPRLLVFSAAFGALIVMTVLSAVLGHAVPTLIPERITHFAAAVLFLIFGAKMMREGLGISPDEGVGEEMKEVEMELEEKEHDMARKNSKRRSSNAISPYALESGRGRRSRSDSRLPAPARSPSSSQSRSPSPRGHSIKGALDGVSNLFSLLLSPAWVQTFVMTFLGEWGDRSQIATIAMAAGNDYWWVTFGAISGHAVCTAAAVIGGRAIAGRVSLRVVTLGGAIAFLVFGIIYLAEAMLHS